MVLLLMEKILHQLIGRLSHYLQGFIHPMWCRISSIKSSTLVLGMFFFEVKGAIAIVIILHALGVIPGPFRFTFLTSATGTNAWAVFPRMAS